MLPQRQPGVVTHDYLVPHCTSIIGVSASVQHLAFVGLVSRSVIVRHEFTVQTPAYRGVPTFIPHLLCLCTSPAEFLMNERLERCMVQDILGEAISRWVVSYTSSRYQPH